MRYIYVLIAIILFSCNEDVNSGLSAKSILQKSIDASGRENFFNSTIKFNVEELQYEIYRKEHISKYVMTRQVDTTFYKAIYEMGHFEYYVNDEIQRQTSQGKVFFDTKLEGFVYLFSIPHILDQNAVILTRLEDAEIDGKSYFAVYATFQEVEGVPQDQFILYIDPDTYLVDFYAQKYSLFMNRKKFKKAVNSRFVEDIRFTDHHVYYFKGEDNTPLDQFYKLYNDDVLNRQNDVILENILVEINPED